MYNRHKPLEVKANTDEDDGSPRLEVLPRLSEQLSLGLFSLEKVEWRPCWSLWLSQGDNGEGGADLLPLVTSKRMWGDGRKLHQGRFRLIIRKSFFTGKMVGCWIRVQRKRLWQQDRQSSNSVWMMLWYVLVLGSPMRSRELGWMILMGPFPSEIFYGLQSPEHFLLALWRHCYYRNKAFPWRKWAVWKSIFADPTLIIILERLSNLQPTGYEEVMLLNELAGLACSFPSFVCLLMDQPCCWTDNMASDHGWSCPTAQKKVCCCKLIRELEKWCFTDLYKGLCSLDNVINSLDCKKKELSPQVSCL